jgi:hypothetical protein
MRSGVLPRDLQSRIGVITYDACSRQLGQPASGQYDAGVQTGS